MLVEELRSRRAHDEEREVAVGTDDAIEEIEERRLGPVDIVDDEDDGPVAREMQEEQIGRAHV